MEARGASAELIGGARPEGRPAFKLAWHTPVEWVARVSREPLLLLSDHAHCEMKAAASAQGLIARRPGWDELVSRLAEVAVEEMEHFVEVCAILHRRGGRLQQVTPNPYAEGLLARARETCRDRMLDRLLVSSLIEARSLERFHLLAEHVEDAELRELYAGLLRSEASHQGLFLNLARARFPREDVAQRLEELRVAEGELVSGLAFDYRMHSGLEGAGE